MCTTDAVGQQRESVLNLQSIVVAQIDTNIHLRCYHLPSSTAQGCFFFFGLWSHCDITIFLPPQHVIAAVNQVPPAQIFLWWCIRFELDLYLWKWDDAVEKIVSSVYIFLLSIIRHHSGPHLNSRWPPVGPQRQGWEPPIYVDIRV